MGPQPQDTLMELGKRYGNVLSFRMGSQLAIVLNDYEAIKAAFSEQADVFAGRGGGFVSRYIRSGSTGKTHGVGAPQGNTWKEGRKFMLQTFRDLGMGKSHLQESIIAEANCIADSFINFNGQPFDPSPFLFSGAGNVIGSLCFGKRFEYEDPSFRRILAGLGQANVFKAHVQPLQSYPWLRFLPGRYRKLWHTVKDTSQYLLLFLRNIIEEHRKNYQETKTRDYIDAFFHRQREAGTTSTEVFQDEELLQNLRGFFTAGTDTTAITMRWVLLFMLHHPKIQDCVHNELDQKIEVGRRIVLEDRAKLPYLEAVIREVQRLANIIPLGLPRTNSTETILLGYRIPANSIVFPNFKSVNEDATLWNDPQTFDPTRFLDRNGKVHEPIHFMPFSIGKRACVGESLARMELFLLFANLMHRLVFKAPPDEVLPATNERITFLASGPKPFSICVFPRSY
ncbi:Cytochrome P450 2U1 [Hypsibius exemplaris]|uniref:Cytochrome P450 2U1 n=1 Tax=Hypsibius exemplaris TaxID=2072580 RepID=A0A1W0WH96_HYPEX|nr:Cytochrome P450 2U1 [Hypsibius exemplaris]